MHWIESDSEREINMIEGILLNTWKWVDWFVFVFLSHYRQYQKPAQKWMLVARK